MAQLQRRCLPELWDVLSQIPDPRNTEECTYTVSQLAGLAALMFCCRSSSRRQWDRMTQHDLLRDNWCTLTGVRTDTAAVYGAVRYLGRQVDPVAFGALPPQLVRGLLRCKQLPGAHVPGPLPAAGLVRDRTVLQPVYQPAHQGRHGRHEPGRRRALLR